MKTRLGQLGAVIPFLFLSATVLAADADDARKAEHAVREALQREIYGLAKDRESLLQSAVNAAPKDAAAHWHLGYVRGADGEWTVGGDVGDKSYRELLAQYDKLRATAANTVDAQLELADWCARKKLWDRERVHLARVCELAPSHIAARQRLGFVRVGRDWVSRAEINFVQNREAALQKAAAQWGPSISKLAAQLGSPDAQKRATAAEQIKEITDVTAVPTLQQLVAPRGEEHELLVVEVCTKIEHLEATVALAQHAVLSRSANVRQAAAKALASRDRVSYVPLLLSAMYSPVVSQLADIQLPTGQIGYRHSFLREGAERNELLILNTQYNRIPAAAGSGAHTRNRAAHDAEQSAAQMELSVAAQNAATEKLNERLAAALNIATEANLPADPAQWWKWWSDENEIFVQGSKPTVTESRSRSVNLVETDSNYKLFQPRGETVTLARVEPVRQPLFFTRMADCLAAGTPVWTDRGMVAVEKVVAGDMVLSRNIESGELAYKPVMRTTIRPSGPLIQIQAGDETIESSGGHPFWVSGDGWAKARNLKSGMVLHTSTGPIRVTEVSEVKAAPTYNLIVADFNTYFVGKQKLLSHDNTVRQPTNVVVPGLQPE